MTLLHFQFSLNFTGYSFSVFCALRLNFANSLNVNFSQGAIWGSLLILHILLSINNHFYGRQPVTVVENTGYWIILPRVWTWGPTLTPLWPSNPLHFSQSHLLRRNIWSGYVHIYNLSVASHCYRSPFSCPSQGGWMVFEIQFFRI